MLTELPETAIPPHGDLRPGTAQRFLLGLAHRSFLKRGAFRPTLARLLHLCRPGPIDAEYQGAAFRLHYRSNATESGALLNPNYNIEELRFLRSHLAGDDTFIDIGANVGTVALPVARHLHPQGRVIAIEPHPTALARLEFNKRASGLDNVTILPVAAADADGETTMLTGSTNLGASRIAPAGSAESMTVAALTLSTILARETVRHIGALKIDVEGFEDRVLTGFFATMPRSAWPRAVVIEYISRDLWQTDCIELMEANGYRISARTRSNTMLVLESR